MTQQRRQSQAAASPAIGLKLRRKKKGIAPRDGHKNYTHRIDPRGARDKGTEGNDTYTSTETHNLKTGVENISFRSQPVCLSLSHSCFTQLIPPKCQPLDRRCMWSCGSPPASSRSLSLSFSRCRVLFAMHYPPLFPLDWRL